MAMVVLLHDQRDNLPGEEESHVTRANEIHCF